jgi:hypothetical protein
MAFDLSSAKPIENDGYMAGEATSYDEFEKQWADSMASAPKGSELAQTDAKIRAENNVQPVSIGFDLSTAKPVEVPKKLTTKINPKKVSKKDKYGRVDGYSLDNVIPNAKSLGENVLGELANVGNNIIGATTYIPRLMERKSAPTTLSSLITGKKQNTPLNDYVNSLRNSNDQFLKERDDSPGSTIGRLGVDIAATAGVGDVLAIVANAAKLPRLAKALSSSGMNIGGDTAPFFSKEGAKNLALRAGGGGATGYAAGEMIDLENAGTTAGISAAIPVVGKVAGSTGKALATEVDDLAKTAIGKYNIPLDKASTSNNKLTKATKSVLDDILPFGFGKKNKDAMTSAFNREVGKVAGIDAEPVTGGALKLTPEAVAKTKAEIGQAYNKVWNTNKFTVDRQFADDATSLISDASKKLNPEQASMLERHFDNLISQAKDGKIDGQFVNNWQSELRKIAESEKGLHQKFVNDLRQKTLNAFKRNISPDDAKLLSDTNIRNRAFKTLKPLLDKGEAGVAGRDMGDIPPSLLSSAIAGNYDNVSSSPFGELPRIGSKYLVDRVARTGGSERSLIQQLLALGGLSAGAGVVGGSGAIAAGLPLAYSTQKYLSGARNVNPANIDNLMQSQLLQNLIKANPALINASRR